MPEPEPQPTQPRTVPFWKWMLMLTPSALWLLAVPLLDSFGRLLRTKSVAFWQGGMLIALLLPILLCFVLAFALEKWRFGKIGSAASAYGWGFAILFVNLSISLLGCALILPRL